MFLEIFSWFRSTDTRKGTKKRSIPLQIQRLEDRTLCAVDATRIGTTIRIIGDSHANSVQVVETPTHFRVTGDGAVFNFEKSGISNITAFLGMGNDSYNGGGVSKPQTVRGEAGNDTIVTGSAADRLFGGDGRDSLFGGNGFDTLVGQNGNDLLYGQGGIDWMAGGPGADTFFANGDNLPDRLPDVTASDTVNGDLNLNVQPQEVLDDRTNNVNYFGTNIRFDRAANPPGTTGIFYYPKINGVIIGGLHRKVDGATIMAFVKRGGTVTYSDPTLEADLGVQRGLLA